MRTQPVASNTTQRCRAPLVAVASEPQAIAELAASCWAGREGYRPSDKKAKKVLAMHRDGLSYRLISRNLGLSKNTVMEIIRRAG
jgi:DNA-binding NarL/FixJ family response regulator